MIPVEAQLLRLLLRREDWETYGNLVDPEQLPDRAHQRVFQIIQQYHEKDLGLPDAPDLSVDNLWYVLENKEGLEHNEEAATLFRELLAYMGDTSIPRGLAADVVKEYIRGSILTQLGDLSFRWSTSVTQDQKDALWGRVEHISGSLETLEAGYDVVVPQSIREDPEALEETGERIPFGFLPSVDRAIGGGVPLGRMVCVCAPPGVGKTRLLCNAGAAAVRRGYTVYHATLEIDAIELRRWYYSILAGTSTDALRDSSGCRRRATSIWEDHPEWGDVIIADYSGAGCTLGSLRKGFVDEVKRQAEKGRRISLFLVDYPALLDDLDEDRYTGLGKVLRGLRKLGSRYEAVTYVAAQASRQALIRGETLPQDVADSMEIYRIVDMMLMASQNEVEREGGSLRLTQQKNRLGGTFPRVQLLADKNTLTLKEFGS